MWRSSSRASSWSTKLAWPIVTSRTAPIWQLICPGCTGRKLSVKSVEANWSTPSYRHLACGLQCDCSILQVLRFCRPKCLTSLL